MPDRVDGRAACRAARVDQKTEHKGIFRKGSQFHGHFSLSGQIEIENRSTTGNRRAVSGYGQLKVSYFLWAEYRIRQPIGQGDKDKFLV
jgi:hypothetical protein